MAQHYVTPFVEIISIEIEDAILTDSPATAVDNFEQSTAGGAFSDF